MSENWQDYADRFVEIDKGALLKKIRQLAGQAKRVPLSTGDDSAAANMQVPPFPPDDFMVCPGVAKYLGTYYFFVPQDQADEPTIVE